MAAMTQEDTSETPTRPSNAHARRVTELNSAIQYTMWSVFAAPAQRGDHADQTAQLAELEQLWTKLIDAGVAIRGSYDLAGLRADADLMVWWHAGSIELLQDAYSQLRQTRIGAALRPVWSQAALHRSAEFNKSHLPAFVAGEPARDYVCVYPFVRSYEWYLLPDAQRRAMLAEHGAMARGFPDVRANTVASFGLGDYEWMLAFEADELHRIVDLMRELRASSARRHVRVEVPFYTGRRRELADIVARWP